MGAFLVFISLYGVRVGLANASLSLLVYGDVVGRVPDRVRARPRPSASARPRAVGLGPLAAGLLLAAAWPSPPGLVTGRFGMPWAIGVDAVIAAAGALWTLTLQQRTTVPMPGTH
jgi:hypothetical protein